MEKVLSIIAHILASIVPSLILKLCTAIFFLNNSFALHFTPVVSESSQMHKLSDPKSHLARAGSHQLTSNSQLNPTTVGAKTEWMVVGSRPVFPTPISETKPTLSQRVPASSITTGHLKRTFPESGTAPVKCLASCERRNFSFLKKSY